jgi:protein O-mannosyl-transferase
MSEDWSLLPEKRLYWVLALFALLVLVVFSPALSADFVNYDDPEYLLGNQMVRQGLSAAGFAWAFTTSHAYNWHPLTWLSHMLDVQMYGMNPLGHHLTSVLFHLANSLLLFAFLRKTTGATWRSLCVAALFALHPLHVQSVAWVSERKDVLSTFFWLLTMLAYALYAENRQPVRYLALLGLFILGLMAKPMLVTLPFVLLLLDYWPLSRFGSAPRDGETSPAATRLLAEKVPLLLLAAGSSVVTYLVQEKTGALSYQAPWWQCLGNAVLTYLRYLDKTLFPRGLAAFYPFDASAISLPKVAAAALFILAVTFLALKEARKRPYLVTGWFWYLGTLVPVIGLVKIGQHAMADRYTYVPLIGIFIAVVWGVGELAAKWQVPRAALAALAAIVFIPLSVASWRQACYWHDSVSLFSHALEVTDGNSLAHENLAKAYGDRGDYQNALLHISALLALKPDPVQFVSQAWLYSKVGDYDNSIASCRKALALAPNNDKAHFLLGMDYLFLKQYPAAVAEYNVLQASGSRFSFELLGALQEAGINPAAAQR